MNTDFLILLLWQSVVTDSISVHFCLRNMLYQGPEGSSTPWKPVLALLQVSVLLIYAEPNHGERNSGATVVSQQRESQQ